MISLTKTKRTDASSYECSIQTFAQAEEPIVNRNCESKKLRELFIILYVVVVLPGKIEFSQVRLG